MKRALLLLPLLSACARPLAPAEADMAQALFGPTLDTSKVSVSVNLGLLPLPEPWRFRRAAGAGEAEPVAPPPGLCERKRSTKRHYTGPAAFVLWNSVFIGEDYYLPDSFKGVPGSAPYPASVLMAHELVHVWQWQNRAVTHYTPIGGASETADHIDPYWFEVDPNAEFLSYGYEQQAAMVQDFTCYALFDRQSPRLDELVTLLRPVLPVDDFLAKLTP